MDNDKSSNTASELETLRWQFQLTWKLASGWTLPGLTDRACLWEPAPGSWTVRPSAAGVWQHDWAEVEPVPAPPVTIGWLTWQVIWWWSGLLSAVRGETPPAHHEVAWPGSAEAVILRLETLSAEWDGILASLSESDLEKPLAYPWPEPRPLKFAIAWANSELMKNIAEIGILRHIYDAQTSPGKS